MTPTEDKLWQMLAEIMRAIDYNNAGRSPTDEQKKRAWQLLGDIERAEGPHTP